MCEDSDYRHKLSLAARCLSQIPERRRHASPFMDKAHEEKRRRNIAAINRVTDEYVTLLFADYFTATDKRLFPRSWLGVWGCHFAQGVVGTSKQARFLDYLYARLNTNDSEFHIWISATCIKKIYECGIQAVMENAVQTLRSSVVQQATRHHEAGAGLLLDILAIVSRSSFACHEIADESIRSISTDRRYPAWLRIHALELEVSLSCGPPSNRAHTVIQEARSILSQRGIDPEVHRRSVGLLGDLEYECDRDALSALQAILASIDDSTIMNWVRERAVIALSQWASGQNELSPKAEEELLALLRNAETDEETRMVAARSIIDSSPLRNKHSLAAIESIDAMLDRDERTSIESARLLCMLITHSDPRVSSVAIECVGERLRSPLSSTQQVRVICDAISRMPECTNIELAALAAALYGRMGSKAHDVRTRTSMITAISRVVIQKGPLGEAIINDLLKLCRQADGASASPRENEFYASAIRTMVRIAPHVIDQADAVYFGIDALCRREESLRPIAVHEMSTLAAQIGVHVDATATLALRLCHDPDSDDHLRESSGFALSSLMELLDPARCKEIVTDLVGTDCDIDILSAIAQTLPSGAVDAWHELLDGVLANADECHESEIPRICNFIYSAFPRCNTACRGIMLDFLQSMIEESSWQDSVASLLGLYVTGGDAMRQSVYRTLLDCRRRSYNPNDPNDFIWDVLLDFAQHGMRHHTAFFGNDWISYDRALAR